MRLDLAERLRCPNDHVPTPLIVVASRVVDRELVEGTAGCMVCHLEARVKDGVVHFAAPHEIELSTGGEEGGAERVAESAADARAALPPADSSAALERTAALLGLAEPGGTVLLSGRYAALASDLQKRFEVTTVVIRTNGAIPFTDQTFRAVAIDASPTDADGNDAQGVGGREAPRRSAMEEAARTLSVGGRYLTPHTSHLPPALKELARDDQEVVGERQMEAQPVRLSRAQGPRTTNQ